MVYGVRVKKYPLEPQIVAEQGGADSADMFLYEKNAGSVGHLHTDPHVENGKLFFTLVKSQMWCTKC